MTNTRNLGKHGPFQVDHCELVYQNPWIEVREDRVTHANGAQGLFGIVTMKPGSTVLAIDQLRHVFLVREFKYAYGRESLELVSGGIDPGEAPLAAAQRELQEELGFVAEDWQPLGEINPFTVVVDSPNYLFIAQNLRETDISRDDFEQIEVARLPLVEAQRMAEQGEITHAASVVLLLRSKLLGL